MFILAVIAHFLVLPNRFHFFVHVSEALCAVAIYLAQGFGCLSACQLHVLELTILLLLSMLLLNSLLLLTNE